MERTSEIAGVSQADEPTIYPRPLRWRVFTFLVVLVLAGSVGTFSLPPEVTVALGDDLGASIECCGCGIPTPFGNRLLLELFGQ